MMRSRNYKENMIVRQRFLDLIQKKLELCPIWGLLGSRQVGKTILARQYAKKYFDNDAEFFDLKDSTDLVCFFQSL